MNDHGITKENLMETLPPALRTDPSVTALAEALATVLAERVGELDRLLIYPAIDRLEEPLLDLLAYDFKVDWWDGNYSLKEKRQTLKDSWRVHKTLGTKAAVETAISAIYPETKVAEWFEYGGEPYHFKLYIDVSHEDIHSERHRRVLERMNFYKNLRSHLDSIIYIIRAEGTATGYTAAAAAGQSMRNTVLVQPGGVHPPDIRADVPAAACAGGAYLRLAMPVELRGEVRPPHPAAGAASGVGLSGWYVRVQTEVKADGVGMAHIRPSVYTGGKATGTYFKVKTGVSI